MEKQTAASSTASATTAIVGEVDLNPSTIHLTIIETSDGIIGFFAISESDKTESARAASVAIAHHD